MEGEAGGLWFLSDSGLVWIQHFFGAVSILTFLLVNLPPLGWLRYL